MLLSQLKLAPELLNTEMDKMSRSIVTVTIPKFKIQTDLDLKELYQKVRIAF
jgi:serine protease inhibitor